MSTYKFNELQLAWIKALKSRKFKQGTGVLCSEGSDNKMQYCCLGVACKVAGITPIRLKTTQGVIFKFSDNVVYAPRDVIQKLKLRTPAGGFKESFFDEKKGIRVGALTILNDDLKWSFKKIGEYIENNPENVFKS